MIGIYHHIAAGREKGKPRTVYRLFNVSGNGIQKADKLLKRSEFIHLSKHGKSVHNRYFVVVFQTNRSDRTRLGITVTKKVGNAVTRNRIKRIVRESFRLNRHLIKENRDINVIAKKAAADATGGQAIASLRALFGKMGGV